MRFAWIVCAAIATLASAQTRAATVFVTTLSGASERPAPVDTGAVGSATAMLTGDTGGYVLSYSLNYTGLGSDAVGGNIHYSISPAGRDPRRQTGPAVHPLDADFSTLGTQGTISGQWRFDDAESPLTDALVDSLLDGELYFNIGSIDFGGGELRGQIEALGGATETDASNGTAIPLPPAVLVGLAGLGAAACAARRGRRTATN
jgi:hypothetical protein